jgi:hypothetical protein
MSSRDWRYSTGPFFPFFSPSPGHIILLTFSSSFLHIFPFIFLTKLEEFLFSLRIFPLILWRLRTYRCHILLAYISCPWQDEEKQQTRFLLSSLAKCFLDARCNNTCRTCPAHLLLLSPIILPLYFLFFIFSFLFFSLANEQEFEGSLLLFYYGSWTTRPNCICPVFQFHLELVFSHLKKQNRSWNPIFTLLSLLCESLPASFLEVNVRPEIRRRQQDGMNAVWTSTHIQPILPFSTRVVSS